MALTAEECERLVELLAEVTWPMQLEVFNALLKAAPSVAIELVVLTETGQVVLLPRPEKDLFAGKLHGPGTVLRGGEGEEDAIKRARKELGTDVRFSEPYFVDRIHVPMGDGPMECVRGQEVGLIFALRLLGGTLPDGAVLADPENLPPNIIGFHRQIIPRGVAWLREHS
ncbi:MAG TPA: hypothetical protein VMU13_00630 [Candidatus Paceibacterota bacterium]|nr:hypothetical protein [Candidatus Paceibacterota bacterium]